jgi:large-conductance mechanosensitive channel
MGYFLFILLLSSLFAAILRQLFKILRTYFPTLEYWLEETAKPAFQKLGKIVLALIIFLLLWVPIWLLLLLISGFHYLIYFRKRREARNPETKPEQLQKLAEVRDTGTQRWVAKNPNTPPDLLLKLGEKFPRELLSNPVFNLMLLEDANLFETMPQATLKRIMAVRDIPVGFLERSAAIPSLDIEVARVIAQHPNATEYTFEKIAQYSWDATVTRLLIERSRLSGAILKKMADNGSLGLKQYLEQRPRLSEPVLKKVVQNAIEMQALQPSPGAMLFLFILAQAGTLRIQSFLVRQQNLPESVLKVLAEYGKERTQIRKLALQRLAQQQDFHQ